MLAQSDAGPHQNSLAADLDGALARCGATGNKDLREGYGAKYPKGVACLPKDVDELLVFYSFPAEHWASLRTMNPIGSTFATIRHQTRQSRGCFSRKSILAMVYKLALGDQQHWRRMKGYGLLGQVELGMEYKERLPAQPNMPPHHFNRADQLDHTLILNISPSAKMVLSATNLLSTKTIDGYTAAQREACNFAQDYMAQYPRAVEFLRKDLGQLLTFYDFPAEHRVSLQTTNTNDPTFATLRQLVSQSRGFFSRMTILAMFYKLLELA